MTRLLPRYFRRRGVRTLRGLVPLVDPRAESPRESWARLELADRGMPIPEPQFWIYVDGVPTYRLDLAYPYARIAIEYDGAEFHMREDDRERDRTRREWLRQNGWKVVVVTKANLESGAWVQEVAAALVERVGWTRDATRWSTPPTSTGHEAQLNERGGSADRCP